MRTRRLFALTAAVAVLLAGVAACDEVTDRDEGRDDPPASDTGEFHRQATSNIETIADLYRRGRPFGSLPPVRWPEPIGPQDVARYMTLMTLPESKSDEVSRAYVRFQQRVIELLKDEMPDVWAGIKPMTELSRESDSAFERAEVIRAFDTNHYTPMLEHITRLEREFLVQLVALVPDDDFRGTAMSRIEDDRRRTRYAMMLGGPVGVPGSHIDLIELLDSTDALTFDPDTDVGEVAVAYLHEIGPLRQRRFEGFLDGRADDMLGLAEGSAGSGGDFQTAVQLRTRARRDMVRAEQRMQAVNQEYVLKFARVLPDEVGEQLKKQFRELSYPQIYPDVKDRMLRERFPIWLEVWDLDEEQKDLVRAMRDEYHAWYAEARQRVERAIDAFQLTHQEDGMFHADEREAYQDAIDAFTETRDEKYRQITSAVNEMRDSGATSQGAGER